MAKAGAGMEQTGEGKYKVSIDGKPVEREFDSCVEAAAFMEGILWGWEDAAEHRETHETKHNPAERLCFVEEYPKGTLKEESIEQFLSLRENGTVRNSFDEEVSRR